MHRKGDPSVGGSQTVARITSLNIGPRVEVDIFGQVKLTAYEKHPVNHDIFIDKNGIIGDGHYARDAEEGLDHAVQMYCTDNYAFWSGRLNKPLRAGVFGESITYEGPGEFSVRIGDIVRIGEVKLQISGPRIPCAKLAHFIGEDISFPRTYHETSRTGIYARVLSPGKIARSAQMVFETVDPALPLVGEIAAALLQREPDQNWMRALADQPLLSVMIRTMYAKKLEALSRRASK